MTRGIENMLNLPHLDDLLKDGTISRHPQPDLNDDGGEAIDTDAFEAQLNDTLARAEKAGKRLAMIDGSDHADAMDDLYGEVRKHAQDLMDLGFNIDHARARGIFEVASSMYKNAMDAKNSKRDAELKAMKLSLDQKKLELDTMRVRHEMGAPAEGGTITEAVVVEDRNELIKRLRAQIKQDKDV